MREQVIFLKKVRGNGVGVICVFVEELLYEVSNNLATG